MIPPVGKSGPLTIRIRSSVAVSGSSIRRTTASQISPRLCGGMLVAMPTAIPLAPLTRRFGSSDGITDGSRTPRTVAEVGPEARIAHPPRLREAAERVVHRRITMRVVLAEDLADDGGALLIARPCGHPG